VNLVRSTLSRVGGRFDRDSARRGPGRPER
jgi:hypothetical protein